MSKKVIVRVVLPERSNDTVSNGLRRIVEKLIKKGVGEANEIGLGGEFGYGVDFENDVFMIHPFCWCFKEECLWCSNKKPNFLHKNSESEITWYKWIGRDMKIKCNKNWDEIMKECISSISKLTRKKDRMGQK